MVKKIIVGVVLYAVVSNILYGQNRRPLSNIAYLSAGEYYPESVTPFSFAENPAALMDREGVNGSIYAEQKYMLENLGLFAVSGLFAMKGSAAGMAVNYFGSPEYNEMNMAVNYGRSLGKVNIGISICYDVLSISAAGKQSGISMGISSVWKLAENCYATVQAKDIHVSKQNASGKASQYKLGLGYRTSAKINTGFEFVKEELKPPQFVLNIRYTFEEKYFARAGFISGSAELFVGAGWEYRNLRTEIIARQHARLGITPGILFVYQNKKR